MRSFVGFGADLDAFFRKTRPFGLFEMLLRIFIELCKFAQRVFELDLLI